MKLKSFFLGLFLLCTTGAIAQHHNGIGIRFGEPIALTYKKYLPSNRALEFMVGTAPTRFAKGYYEKTFDQKYEDYYYYSHHVRNIVYLQGRYQFHYQIPTEGIEGKLDWYWGFGATFKSSNVRYRYKEIPASQAPIYEVKRTDIDFGPDGMIGLEFTMQNAPFTVLAEMSTFLELADRTTIRVLAGVGIRANF